MSLEAYNIAVKISLVENVTRGLALMSRHFATANAEGRVLEARLLSIGKMAAAGAIFTGAGLAGLAMFKGPIEEAMKYERTLGSLRQMGLGDAQIADARKFSEATNIIGTSINDRIRLFTEAQGSFRESGLGGMQALRAAKVMTPLLGTYEVATGMLGGEKRAAAEQAMRSLNKTVEIMGGLTDTKRAAAIVEGVFKASQSSGRMVDERQLKQFVAYGSSATNQQNLRTIFGGLEPIIGELGGSTAAVGLRTAYTRTNGMMALMPKRLQAEMQRLGMTDASGTQQTDTLARLQATDAIGYAQNIMARYAQAGITNRTDIERENAIIFGTNGSKVFNKIMSQMPVLLDSLLAYDRARGPQGVVDDPANKPLIAGTELQKKRADLELRIGQIILPYYVRSLEIVAGVLTRIDNFVENHKPFAKIATGAFALISVASVVGGSLLLLTAGLRGLLLISSIVPVLKAVWTGISILRSGLLYLPQLLRVLLVGMGPVGWVILGIGTTALLVWNNWKEIAASFKLWTAEMGAGFRAIFNGNILDGLHHFAAAIALGFQTIFNTVIAGLNAINPFGQIGKLTFADGMYDRLNGGPKPNVIPPAKGQMLQVHTAVNMDGRKVAEAVTHHQVKGASRPNQGSTSPDWNRAQPYHGMLTGR